jgi:hypothetical protein
MLIGLNGFRGVGKNTAADYLTQAYGFKQVSFAAPLKQSVADLFDISLEQIEEWKNNVSIRVEIVNDGDAKYDPIHAFTLPPIKSQSFREFLQRYGTEAHRDVFGEDFWVDRAFDQIEGAGDYVFSDARFVNELEAIKGYGGFNVRVERDVAVEDSHASEQIPPADLIDYFVSNKHDFEYMYEQLDRLMNQLGWTDGAYILSETTNS